MDVIMNATDRLSMIAMDFFNARQQFKNNIKTIWGNFPFLKASLLINLRM